MVGVDTCQCLTAAGGAPTAEKSTEKIEPKKADESKAKSSTGFEDLFKDSPSLSAPQVSEKPQKDVKNDIMSLFEKVHAATSFHISWKLLFRKFQRLELFSYLLVYVNIFVTFT